MSNFSQPPAPVNPLHTLIETSALTFERYLLTALARSIRLYRTHRANLCPINPATGRYRQDFSTNRFNLIYKAIDMFWRCYDIVPVTADMEIPQLHLEALIIDAANRGEIPSDVAQEILNDIKLDLYAGPPPVPAFLEAMGGAVFAYWLNLRVAAQTVNKLNAQAAASSTTLDDLAATVTKAKMQLPGSTNTIINGQTALRGSHWVRGAISTGLPRLDQALGGGLMFGESTMIGGINGGGKSLIGIQFVGQALSVGYKVAHFTTEESVRRVAARLAINRCHIPAELVNAPVPVAPSDKVGILANTIPAELWAHPVYGPKLAELDAMLKDNLFIVDWSEGTHSVVASFDAEMDKLDAAGCVPDMVVFDWVGGALERDKDPARRRLLFEESAEHLIHYARRHKLVMVLMVQLDKTRAQGKERPTMSMVAECKSMTNRVENFIALSSVPDSGQTGQEGRGRLRPRQFLNVDKARNGPGGAVPVVFRFEIQTIMPAPAVLAGGG